MVGSGFVYTTVCDGTPQAYRTVLRSNDGRRFKPGPATVLASGYAFGSDEAGGSVSQTTSVGPQPITTRRPD